MYPALLTQATIGKYALSNKVVMAPAVTKRRVNDGVPNELMVEYYSHRAGAGLIIAEGTSPVESGMGHAHMPGIYSKAQVAGWKKVTEAVHANGGKIFLQIMHTGRISHPANMPAKTRIVAPSAIAANGQIWTAAGYQPYGTPRAMSTAEVQEMVQLHVKAAKQAIEAGFDGVELHAANGYLMEQFLHPDTNQRTDKYGGTIPNRVRFILETVAAVSAAIGKDRTGIRLSPYSKVNDLQHHGQINTTYEYLVDALDTFSLSYIHIVDGHSLGEPEIPAILLAGIRARFNGPLILNGNFDALKAEDTLRSGLADFVAFEQPCSSGVKLSGPRMIADCLS
ncbi:MULTISPECIES: alkene reductase [unclassified Chitinophaga]|uniref:alkene reductase n=1 Tax=unclassified Chitinophaga TaxID=2619133 RepID=UPI0009CC7993|nr:MULTISPECIES: alkene reductase [unclassified Chitinophaga]OMP79904.1 alkene reductase [[Flexibacter] sp. ATCC 35208]WPV64154.1 alkene reductase [Chitinophaga sp. LS1]